MKRAALTLLLSCFSVLATGCGSSYDLSREHNQLNFGVQAAKMNLWREALFRSQRAVALNPADAMARNNLAVAFEGVGDFEKARAAYLEALRLDRTNSYIQKNFSRFTEFTAKNRKREKAAVAPVASKGVSAPAESPVSPQGSTPPPGVPVPVPPPPSVPVTSAPVHPPGSHR